MDEFKSNWKIEIRQIFRILKDNGIDVQKIPASKATTDGKRVATTLKDINGDGIDILKILKENGFNEDFPIGHYITRYRNAYTGTAGNLTQEEREEGEILGIVVKRNENASAPIFKGRKLSQFHLNYIEGILDQILNGQINMKEALELLKQACIENKETVIIDSGSIRRCVELLLKDRPEDLKKFHEMVKKNTGRRSPYKGKIGKPKVGLYYKKELEFKQHVIDHYLPLILNYKITLEKIEQELSCSHHTVEKIIEEFYIKNNDLEGLKKYQDIKKSHVGGSIETRENAAKKREEVANYKVVTNNEFLLLAPEEQEVQLIMKIRLDRLKEEKSETSSSKSSLIGEEAAKDRINLIMDYFKSKNNPDFNEIYFSEDDIRYMIFRYPTLINRATDTLDEKINVLTSCNQIDEKTAYGMIKTFPAIMGYEASRTKKQLELLEQENLIDAVISSPRRFMQSINLMYALIQYAKERHNTSDLSEINRTNIFSSNSTLKQCYKTSYNEIKSRYPYIIEEEKDTEYAISPDEIGKATYSARAKSTEASEVLNQAIKNTEKGEKS